MDGSPAADGGETESYDADILAWSRRQGALLRRIAAGQPLNEAPDWENVAEEIETVGRNELRAVRSLLTQALAHMLKAEAWPDARDAPNWRADAVRFRHEAADALAPSMRQHIDVTALYQRAKRELPTTMDGQQPQPVPDQCLATLDELLSEP